jgi:type II secretory ATPase GspE/PulE/Tfp pilus assembly ATPase PilB-like protein
MMSRIFPKWLPRIVLLGLPALVLVLLGAADALAQNAAAPAADPASLLARGPGSYLSWPKIAALWLVFLAWVHTTDWLSSDAQEMKQQYLRWNIITVASFLGALVLLLLLPSFWLGFPLLLIAYGVPLGTYVYLRNEKAEQHQKVLTPEHLRFLLSQWAGKVGIKIAAETVPEYEKGPPLKLDARGGPNERDERVRLLTARVLPGFNPARQLLMDAIKRRGTAVLLDFTAQEVKSQQLVDGVWIAAEAIAREAADPLLAALKVLCGMNPQDRQTKREGKFVALLDKDSYAATMVCQGVATGERAVVQFDMKQVRFDNLEALGMRPKMQEQIAELFARKQGLLLFSAMPGGGLRSTMNVALRSTDRLLREFVALEAENNRYEEVENIPVTTYPPGANIPELLTKMLRAEPNVVVVRDMLDAPTIAALCQGSAERLFISSVRAKESSDALLRVMGVKASAAEFARSVTAVLSQRLIRKLCEKCKETYTPAPEVLQQFGIPPGRIPAFYRPRPPQPKEEVCPECGGVGYKGRTAVFELLLVDDSLRKLLPSNPKIDVLRQAARKAGLRTFQDEGILVVAKGLTSLPELVRMLKS